MKVIFSASLAIVVGLTVFPVFQVLAEEPVTHAKWGDVNEVVVMPHPVSCTNAVYRDRVEAGISLQGLDADESLRFLSKGWRGKNVIYSVAELTEAREVKLPAMTMASRKGLKKRGLWLERVKTGERVQLTRMQPNMRCNSKGILVATYTDLWVSVGQ